MIRSARVRHLDAERAPTSSPRAACQGANSQQLAGDDRQRRLCGAASSASQVTIAARDVRLGADRPVERQPLQRHRAQPAQQAVGDVRARTSRSAFRLRGDQLGAQRRASDRRAATWAGAAVES
ncbi:MAG: hypothetical protein MZW92_48790 [Comamonadaceae bacterium]|nr:hypothetical protein [Comamonadaceae bacterium]